LAGEQFAQLRVLGFQLHKTCIALVFPCLALPPGKPPKLLGGLTDSLVIGESATYCHASVLQNRCLTVNVYR